MNLVLVIAYEGTHYYGWQQTKVGPSIEETLKNALEKILNEPIVLQAASRTDRGVHALNQVVNFHTQNKALDLHKLQIGVNALLPKDLVIRSIEVKEDHFHPTLDVKSKEYTYEVCYGIYQLPQHRLYSWHYHYALDIAKMRQAAKKLVGTHDFSSFCNQKKNETYTNYVRTVDSISIQEIGTFRILFTIIGAHFLYKMVRNLVGTLVYIGCGKLQILDIDNIFLHKNRSLAGMTAPACGLTLNKVNYDYTNCHLS